MDPRKDYYSTLGVSRDAEPLVIRAAYRALAQKYHPDKSSSQGRSHAHRLMAEINEAYEVLSKTANRHEYDRLRDNVDATFNPRSPNRAAAGESKSAPPSESLDDEGPDYDALVERSRPGDYLYLLGGLIVGGLLGALVQIGGRVEVAGVVAGAAAGVFIALKIRMSLPSQRRLYRGSKFRQW